MKPLCTLSVEPQNRYVYVYVVVRAVAAVVAVAVATAAVAVVALDSKAVPAAAAAVGRRVVKLKAVWELNSVASVNSNNRTTVGLPNNSS